MGEAEKFESVVDYTTILENFEGPLDLLLFLIKQEKIEIKDIFVSKVTEQFLDYMQGLPYIDIDKASEYLALPRRSSRSRQRASCLRSWSRKRNRRTARAC